MKRVLILGGAALVLLVAYELHQVVRLHKLELRRQLMMHHHVDCKNITHPIGAVENDIRACLLAVDRMGAEIE
ncbi:MAG: hypothetical protein HY696_05675 [Deltaproteobacteria bacterium]|nr:hypothetical protein [Deltaproteobacteria bacterium]